VTLLTEGALVHALAAFDGKPTKLVVGDGRTELIARRILHSRHPVTEEALDLTGLGADCPVEFDADLGEGGWELR
jgi:hypothetical protein